MNKLADTDIELSVSFDTTDIKKKSDDMRKTMQKAFDSQAVNEYDAKQKQLLSTMSKVTRQSEAVAKKMQELQETQVPTKQYQDLQKELDKINEKTIEVGNAIADMESRNQGYGKEYTKLIEEMNKLDQAAESVESRMSRMESAGQAYTMADTTEEYAKLQDKQVDLTNQMTILATKAREAGIALQEVPQQAEQGFDDVTQDVRELNEETQQATGIQAWAQKWKDAFMRMVRGSDEAEAEMGELQEDMEGVEDESNEMTQSVTRTSNAFSGFGKSIKLLAIGGLQKGLAGLTQKIKGLVAHITRGGQGMRQFRSNFMNFLKGMIGIASLYTLFSKLRSTIVDTMRTLSQFHDGNNDVNKSLTTLTNSLKQFKNQVGAAFAPILTVVTPILDTFIQKLTEVANTVSQVIAKLTGKSTFIRAKKIQEDYAKSLGKTNKALGAYDKLNVISKDNGGLSADDMFEEVPIEERATEMIEKLKKAWEKADFTEFGRMLGEKIKSGLDTINDWLVEKAHSFAETLGKSIATFLNGVFDTEGLGQSLGQTLANLFNTAIEFLYNFLSNFDFSQLGKFLADSVNSFADTINWDHIAGIISNGINGLFDLIKSFSEQWDAIGLATHMSDTINNIFTDVDWQNIGTSVAEFSNRLFEFISTFVGETDWAQIGESITTAISGFFENFSWGNVAETLSNTVTGLFDFLKGLIDGIEWKELPEGIVDAAKDWFTNLDFAEVAGSFAELFFTALKSLFELGWGIGDCMASLFTGIKDYFSEHINAQEFDDIGTNIVMGILEGISDALSGIWNWIHDNIFQPIVDAFCDVFEIHSPSKVFEEYGVMLIEGLLEGIGSLIEDVKEIFNDIKDSIAEAWNGIKEKTKKVFSSVGKTVSTKFSKIKETIEEKSNSVKEKISSNWQSIKETTAEKFQAVVDTTKEKWSAIRKKISNVSKKVKEDPIGAFEEVRLKVIQKMTSLKDNMSKIWNGIKNVIKDPVNAIIQIMQDFVNSIIDGINWLTEKLNSLPDFEFTNPFDGKNYTFGIDIPTLEHVKIPKLAQGAVIPPNKQFLAMLGDQKSGTNIETPLNTMIEAFKTALTDMNLGGGNDQPIVLQLNGKQIAKAVWDEDAKRYKQSGGSAYGY